MQFGLIIKERWVVKQMIARETRFVVYIQDTLYTGPHIPIPLQQF